MSNVKVCRQCKSHENAGTTTQPTMTPPVKVAVKAVVDKPESKVNTAVVSISAAPVPSSSKTEDDRKRKAIDQGVSDRAKKNKSPKRTSPKVRIYLNPSRCEELGIPYNNPPPSRTPSQVKAVKGWDSNQKQAVNVVINEAEAKGCSIEFHPSPEVGANNFGWYKLSLVSQSDTQFSLVD